MKNRVHFPMFVGLFLLIGIFLPVYYLRENIGNIFSQASQTADPQNITISNITDNSFSVSWTTATPTTTSVQYAKNFLIDIPLVAFDDVKKRISTAHEVTINNLSPNTNYQFRIVQNGKIFFSNDMVVTTGPIITSENQLINPLYGTLVDKKDSFVRNALVYASFDGSQLISSPVINGKWTLPLTATRTEDLERYFLPRAGEQVSLKFQTESTSRQISVPYSATESIRVKISEKADESKGSNVGPIIAQAKTNNNSKTEISAGSSEFSILVPEESSGLTSRTPEFRGIGAPNQTAILVLNNYKTTIESAKVQIKANGTWTWKPKNTLLPDKYILSAASFTKDKKSVVTSRTFSILKSGTQVLADSTPSASIKPSPSASLTPSPSPSIVATPSLVASPQTSPPPVTGSENITYLLLAAGTVFIGISFLSIGINLLRS